MTALDTEILAGISDTEIIAGIRAATAAWNAPQETGYYAARWNVSQDAMRRRLSRMAKAGKLERHLALHSSRLGDTWVVVP
jgi:hypothetical protein